MSQLYFPQYLKLQVLPSSIVGASNNNATNIVYLPKRYQAWYQQSQSIYPQGIVWKMTSNKHPDKVWYFLWSGFVHPHQLKSNSHDDDDKLQISSYLLQHNFVSNGSGSSYPHPTTPISNHKSLLDTDDTIIIEPISNQQVPVVKDLLLIPNSPFDFDVLSTMGSYVEQHLLRSLNPIVFSGQYITIPVLNNPSLQAKLMVKDIQLLNGLNLKDTKCQIARISASTSLIIEPFPSSSGGVSHPKKITQSTEQSVHNSDSTTSKSSSSHLVNKIQFEDLIALNLSQASKGMSLRVLPQHLRNNSCKFQRQPKILSSNSITNSHNSEMLFHEMNHVLTGDEILDALFTEEENEGGEDANDCKSQDNCENKDNIPMLSSQFSDVCVAKIHPMTIGKLLTKQLNLPLHEITLKQIEMYLQNKTGDWLIHIEHSSSQKSHSSQMIDHYLLSLEVTGNINYNHISIPSEVRRAMMLWDYDLVSFSIIHSTELVHSIPRSITLRPILCDTSSSSSPSNTSHPQSNASTHHNNTSNNSSNNVSMLYEQLQHQSYHILYHQPLSSQSSKMHLSSHSLSSTSNQEHWKHITAEMIISSLLRLIEQHTTENKSFMFGQNSIVRLIFHPAYEYNTQQSAPESDLCIDFLVQFNEPNQTNKTKENHSKWSYLALSISSEEQRQLLCYVLQQIEVLMDQPSRTITSKAQQQTLNNVLHHYDHVSNTMESFDSFQAAGVVLNQTIITQCIHQLACQLCPLLLQRLLSQSSSSLCTAQSLLICGKSGTGKTFLCHYVMKMLHTHGLFCTKTIYVNGHDLVLLPLPKILEVLHQVFMDAKLHAPCVIVMDNLDVLCPSHADQPQRIVDEKSIIIATKINLYLVELQQQYANRRNLIQSHLLMAKEASPSFSSSSSSSSWLVNEDNASSLLSKQVICIATSQSTTSIDSSFVTSSSAFPMGYFHQAMQLPQRIASEHDRILLLRSMLAMYHIPLDEELTAVQQQAIIDRLEVFCLADFQLVIQRIFLRLRLQQSLAPSHTTITSLSSTYHDILHVLTEYTPMYDQRNQVTSTSSFLVKPSTDISISWKTRVAGYRQVQSAIYEVLYYPILFQRLYAQSPIRLPKAIMLYGPPGCGKTFLAKTIGYELFTTKQTSHFYYIKGPQLLNKYIGASEKLIRELFQNALQKVADESSASTASSSSANRNILIFFDEFESLAPRRGKDNTGITDRIVNQLLTFIDGVESSLGGGFTLEDDDSDSDGDGENHSIGGQRRSSRYSSKPQIYIMIGSTRPDLIDPALLRPGRIEKHIYVGLPNSVNEIIELLQMFLPTTIAVIDDCVTSAIHEISRSEKIKSFTVADLKAILDTAYLIAAHEKIDSHSTDSAEDCYDNDCDIPPYSTTAVSEPSSEDKVTLKGDHILKAFQDTRSSISVEDLQYYEDLYSKFRKASSPEDNSSKNNQSEVEEQEKLFQKRYDKIANQKQTFH